MVTESSTTITSGTLRASTTGAGATSRGNVAWRRTSGATSRMTTTLPSPMIVAPKMPGTEPPAADRLDHDLAVADDLVDGHRRAQVARAHQQQGHLQLAFGLGRRVAEQQARSCSAYSSPP
jgi:hypothetical protein